MGFRRLKCQMWRMGLDIFRGRLSLPYTHKKLALPPQWFIVLLLVAGPVVSTRTPCTVGAACRTAKTKKCERVMTSEAKFPDTRASRHK
jgi:hypothetical protein